MWGLAIRGENPQGGTAASAYRQPPKTTQKLSLMLAHSHCHPDSRSEKAQVIKCRAASDVLRKNIYKTVTACMKPPGDRCMRFPALMPTYSLWLCAAAVYGRVGYLIGLGIVDVEGHGLVEVGGDLLEQDVRILEDSLRRAEEVVVLRLEPRNVRRRPGHHLQHSHLGIHTAPPAMS